MNGSSDLLKRLTGVRLMEVSGRTRHVPWMGKTRQHRALIPNAIDMLTPDGRSTGRRQAEAIVDPHRQGQKPLGLFKDTT